MSATLFFHCYRLFSLAALFFCSQPCPLLFFSSLYSYLFFRSLNTPSPHLFFPSLDLHLAFFFYLPLQTRSISSRRLPAHVSLPLRCLTASATPCPLPALGHKRPCSSSTEGLSVSFCFREINSTKEEPILALPQAKKKIIKRQTRKWVVCVVSDTPERSRLLSAAVLASTGLPAHFSRRLHSDATRGAAAKKKGEKEEKG